jgi:hypothetical protein
MFEYIDKKFDMNPILTVEPKDNQPSNVTLISGTTEMLRVAQDGFYVRGVKVEADENEAAAVYRAFKEFLIYHALTKEY